MGWTSYHASFYKNGKVDRKAEMDNLYTWTQGNKKVSVVKSAMVGKVYYAAVKIENEGKTEIIGAVAITGGQVKGQDPYFNFGYKGTEETMGPYYYDCPASILKLLTPTDNETANDWRRKCWENKKKPSLKDLPVGTVIRYKSWDEQEYTLEKMAPSYQFKRTWWLKVGTRNYVPSNRIPDTWEIVENI